MPGMRARTHKYNAKPCIVDGIRFASKFEAKIYGDVKLLVKSGCVASVILQKKFPLFGKSGKICIHIVDFFITFKDGHSEVWEAKGFPTQEWKLKRKLFEDNYPSIKYVVHSKGKK
jgi:hypothetical protein